MLARIVLSAVLLGGSVLPSGGALSPVTPAPSQTALPTPTGAVAPSPPAEDGVVEVTEIDVLEDAAGPTPAPAVPGAPLPEAVVSDVVETDPFQMVGVTWPTDLADGTQAQVRTRTDGEWSTWQVLDAGDEAPDAGTADAAGSRAGTDPLWVEDADAVQVALTSPEAVEDVRVALVDVPSAVDARGAATTSGGVVSTAAHVVPSAAGPTIISRAQWGARAQSCVPDSAQTLVGAVVHHTAGSNSYTTVDAAKRQIQGAQAYHMDARGWCDLGYNFVVDKWGNIYEGRGGSLTKAVVGVHAGGFNTGTVGVAMLGTYDAAPSSATQDAVGRIIGWRLGAYGVDPRGSMSYYTGRGENSRYADSWVSLPRVFGHRDVSFTACPGNGGYGALGTIRAVAAATGSAERYAQARPLVTAMYQDLLGRAPDAGGLADWSARLASGANPVDVAAAITRSEEYNRRKIAEAYRTVLGRTTDEPGVRSWLAAIAAGTVKIDDIANHLVASDEFYLRSGRSDAGLVQSMYRTLLGRAGSASEVSYWTARVPTIGRGGVIQQVTASREAAQRKVQNNYQLFLNRYPDIPGQSLWTDVLLARGEAAVRANILGSEEYRLRAQSRYR